MDQGKYESLTLMSKLLEETDCDPRLTDYCGGYRRGLSRSFFGERYQSENHDKIMNGETVNLRLPDDWFFRGYRDGFAGKEPATQSFD
jgi:hypothetical protein